MHILAATNDSNETFRDADSRIRAQGKEIGVSGSSLKGWYLHRCFHENRRSGTVLKNSAVGSYIEPVHVFSPYYSKVCSIIILPSTSRSLLLRFSDYHFYERLIFLMRAAYRNPYQSSFCNPCEVHHCVISSIIQLRLLCYVKVFTS